MKDEHMSESRFDDMPIEKMVQINQRSMKALHGIWDAVEERLCKEAGEDRFCKKAIGSAKAGAIAARLVDIHREMDAFAAEYGGVPVSLSGER